jgi:hypothetical protein
MAPDGAAFIWAARSISLDLRRTRSPAWTGRRSDQVLGGWQSGGPPARRIKRLPISGADLAGGLCAQHLQERVSRLAAKRIFSSTSDMTAAG